jgi:Carboxypeptidase regulatory-like domain
MQYFLFHRCRIQHSIRWSSVMSFWSSEQHSPERRSDRCFFLGLPLVLLICGFSSAAHAQLSLTSISTDGLPNALNPSSLGPGAAPISGAETSAIISGVVLDANGDTLPGASVTLTSEKGGEERTSVSGNNGEFSFGGLPAGNFILTVTSPGMAPFVRPGIAVGPGERRAPLQISMAIARTTTEVWVVVTPTELAQEQVKAAEQQRVLGVLPNFYSSYIWDAAPLNSRQKFDLAFHSVADPVEFLGTGIIAAAEQATDTFPGYGQGVEGYAKRYGAAYADDVLGRMIGSAILPSLIHQDPRYFYKGSGSVRSRVLYAVSRAVVTRGDDGRTEPNYSRLFGSFAAGGLANLYYPRADRGLGLTLGDGLVSIAGHAADNLIREFLLRRITPNVPNYERGKH